MIEVVHNFEPSKFKWLWTKYVQGVNDRYHCTNSIRGPYSKKLSKLNPSLERHVILDEQPLGTYNAVYICGVASRGYTKHANYPHNVHLAIAPAPDAQDTWEFEEWRVTVLSGRVLAIPEEEQLPAIYRTLPPEFTTCRIYRWAMCWKPNM